MFNFYHMEGFSDFKRVFLGLYCSRNLKNFQNKSKDIVLIYNDNYITEFLLFNLLSFKYSNNNYT